MRVFAWFLSWVSPKKKVGEFERGYTNAIEASRRSDVRALRTAWCACQWGDEYDRGYSAALCELEKGEPL